MDKVFIPYCPCRQTNEDQNNVCIVCGKPFDIDNEYDGKNALFCSCNQPVERHITDKCMICGKSLQDYAMSAIDQAMSFCLCVAITKTRPDNSCDVCDKPKALDKKDVFCFCPNPTETNEDKICVVCAKPKYFNMEYKSACCSCVEKTKTDVEEKCVACGKPKLVDDAVKYCYNKGSCKYASNVNRPTSSVSNRFSCPLRHINWCPWMGDFEKVGEHCKNSHPRNFFERQATIQCSAHLREYSEWDYYTSDFLIKAHDQLFKCSFEINPKGLLKWCTMILKKKNDPQDDETYRFYIEFINSRNQHFYWDAYCVKETSPLYEEFLTSIKIHKDILQPFCDEANNIFYRIFIIHIPHSPDGGSTNYYHACRRYFMLDWTHHTLPERTVYEDNCKCVKTASGNC